MPSIVPTPVEVALRSRLALLNAKSSGRPVREEELIASVVAAGYPRELVCAALDTVRSRNEAYATREGWMPGSPPQSARALGGEPPAPPTQP